MSRQRRSSTIELKRETRWGNMVRALPLHLLTHRERAAATA